jgi:hypothetical protein
MGKLLHIKPKMQWPLGQVFQVKDEFNGHQRGTYYFRNVNGDCVGPFQHFLGAQHKLHEHLAEINRV